MTSCLCEFGLLAHYVIVIQSHVIYTGNVLERRAGYKLSCVALAYHNHHGKPQVRLRSRKSIITLNALPRHEFYETDEKVTISVFDRGADPTQVTITFDPRKVRILSFIHSKSRA